MLLILQEAIPLFATTLEAIDSCGQNDVFMCADIFSSQVYFIWDTPKKWLNLAIPLYSQTAPLSLKGTLEYSHPRPHSPTVQLAVNICYHICYPENSLVETSAIS